MQFGAETAIHSIVHRAWWRNDRFLYCSASEKTKTMIKISKSEAEGSNTVELKVEGMICGDWARELRQTCGQILSEKSKQLVLDFSSVISIDKESIQSLRNLDCSRIRIVGCDLFLKDVIKGAKLKKCAVENPEWKHS